MVLYRTIDDRWGKAFALVPLGIVSEDCGDYAGATARFDESLTHAKEADDPVTMALVLFHLDVVAWGQGNLDRAAELLREAGTVQQPAGDYAYGDAESLALLGQLACEQGDLTRSVELGRERLLLHLEIGSTEELAFNA